MEVVTSKDLKEPPLREENKKGLLKVFVINSSILALEVSL